MASNLLRLQMKILGNVWDEWDDTDLRLPLGVG